MRALPPVIHLLFLPGIPGEPPWVPHVLDRTELARWHTLHAIGRPMFLAAHMGVRMLAALHLGLGSEPGVQAPDPGDFGWATLPSGKPMLTFRDGRPLPLHISVAHGGGLAGAAVCDHGPIGIDVERIDNRRNLLAIAERFFAPDEHEMLARCSVDERTSLFHQWWTRKEAVLKATGVGLRGGLTVRVDETPDRDGWRPVALHGHEARLFVRDLKTPDPGIFGAIAIEGQPGVLQPVHGHLEEPAGWTPFPS